MNTRTKNENISLLCFIWLRTISSQLSSSRVYVVGDHHDKKVIVNAYRGEQENDVNYLVNSALTLTTNYI